MNEILFAIKTEDDLMRMNGNGSPFRTWRQANGAAKRRLGKNVMVDGKYQYVLDKKYDIVPVVVAEYKESK